jgi:hypothetical protein
VVACEQASYAHSIELCEYALESFTTIRHRYGAAHCRLVLGRAYLASEQLGRATSTLEEAHSTLLRCGDRWIEAEAAVELAHAYHLGRREEDTVTLLTAAEQAFVKLGDVEGQDRASRSLWQLTASPRSHRTPTSPPREKMVSR